MTKRASLRASDADRERVAERLKQAAAEGRILAHELEERMATALRARTYGELDETVCDLPGSAATPQPRSHPRQLLAAQPVAGVAILVAVTLVLFLMAAVVIAGFFAFSGLWVVLALVMLVHRGGRYGGRHGSRYDGRHQSRFDGRYGGPRFPR